MLDEVEAHRIKPGQILTNEAGSRVAFKESYILPDGTWMIKLLDIEEEVLFDDEARTKVLIVVNDSI